MNPAKRPDRPDLSTGKENRDISLGPRRLAKAFIHLGEVSRAVGGLAVGVFEQSSPKSNTT